MSTINVLDAGGVSTPIEKPLTPGRAAAASSRPVVLSSEDSAIQSAMKSDLDSIVTAVSDSSTPSPVIPRCPNYETVAASQTDQVMGATGAAGDILTHVIIIPATTSPGAVSIKDGSGSSITIFTGGASSVTTLIPFAVPLGIVAGTAWKVTTGANVSAIGVGRFT